MQIIVHQRFDMRTFAQGSLSATFLPTEVVNRVRSDGLALRGPSIRPDSYRPVATLDERDRLSMSGSPTHPAKWRGRRHRDRAGECVVRSPRRDQVSVAELVGFVFRGDGFGTAFGHSSWRHRHPATERARRAPVPASSAPARSTVDECRHLGPVVPDVPGPHPVEMTGIAHGIDHRLVQRVDVGEHLLEAPARPYAAEVAACSRSCP